MTFSIIAFDSQHQALGVATATGGLAVGGFVPHVEWGVGAIATQGSYTNWLYGPRALGWLRQGKTATETLALLIESDTGAHYRQCIICDRWGGTAGHTGQANQPIKQHMLSANFAIAGNMLSNERVLQQMRQAFLDSASAPLHERLFLVLEAGDAQGGDFRGIRSSAIKVQYVDKPPLDLRVDWSDTACLQRLRSLYAKSLKPDYQEFIQGVPTLEQPSKHGEVFNSHQNK